MQQLYFCQFPFWKSQSNRSVKCNSNKNVLTVDDFLNLECKYMQIEANVVVYVRH